MKNLIISCLLLMQTQVANSQVVIDSIASPAHASAMVDIKSGTKGLLVPRLTAVQRNAIQSPAAGLFVFDTDDQAFYYYKNGFGWVMLINQLDNGLELPFSASQSAVSTLFSITQLSSTGPTTSFAINNPTNGQPVMSLSHNGNGKTLTAAITKTGSSSEVASFANAGVGPGIKIQLLNDASGARGLDVLNTGSGPGVFATSAGGNAIWGITSSISAAGVIGDNVHGEAVVGRNRGAVGVGAVVGRNDSSGYGVKGFNTKNGIGVLGQSGLSGGTGVGGRFENINPANSNEALEVSTNGTGYAANITSTNSTSATRGVRISTTATEGGNALVIANGKIVSSFIDGYVSGTLIDDFHLVIRTAGNCVLSSTNVSLGTVIMVSNFSGGVVTITNTNGADVNIANLKAQLFAYLGGAIWTATQ
ncbi:MAG: hypothetical protein V4717_23380 [Bacteroidota bacterium]